MKFCPECGGKLDRSPKFCGGCGHPIGAQAPAPVSTPPPASHSRPGGTINTIQLTPEEEAAILWEPGDVYEVLCGNLSNTGARKGRLSAHGNEHTFRVFFFESNNPDWGTREWTLCTESEISNGPALLILLRRGGTASVFGVVSMVNRAWTHVLPLGANNLIETSSRMKEIGKQQVASIAKGAGIALVSGAFPVIGPLLGKKAILKQSEPLRETFENTSKVCRSFMFRIAQNADTYWNGSGNSTSGKL